MKRLSAVVGEYTDKQSGQQKAEWANVGVIGISQKGKEYMLLNPEVSLAGLLVKQNVLATNKGEKLSDMVMISIIDEQAQNNNQGQQQHVNQQSQQNGGFTNQGQQQQQAPRDNQGFTQAQGGFQNQQ